MSLFEDTNPRALKDLLAEFKSTSGFPFEAVLASHQLPPEADSPLLRDHYEAFLAWRQQRLWQRIQDATGATEAADLEAGDEGME
ncbi:MAG: hypothetical protein ACT4OM_05640 [Actinomycetota bacterium]